MLACRHSSPSIIRVPPPQKKLSIYPTTGLECQEPLVSSCSISIVTPGRLAHSAAFVGRTRLLLVLLVRRHSLREVGLQIELDGEYLSERKLLRTDSPICKEAFARFPHIGQNRAFFEHLPGRNWTVVVSCYLRHVAHGAIAAHGAVHMNLRIYSTAMGSHLGPIRSDIRAPRANRLRRHGRSRPRQTCISSTGPKEIQKIRPSDWSVRTRCLDPHGSRGVRCLHPSQSLTHLISGPWRCVASKRCPDPTESDEPKSVR